MAFQVLFGIVAFYNLDIDQIDVKTAFFYGLIDQFIYIKLSKDMKTEVNKNMICKLLKALYGLKQFPRLWYKRLSAFLLKCLGLKQTHTDYSIFTTDINLDRLIMNMFVDNIKIIRPKKSGII